MTKAQIAFEMVLHARDNGVLFAWVGMDSFPIAASGSDDR
jgi:hypothetical protein